MEGVINMTENEKFDNEVLNNEKPDNENTYVLVKDDLVQSAEVIKKDDDLSA